VDHRVFINYRGADSRIYGALLYGELVSQFGEHQVFLDSESIPAGADELLSLVRSARVVLAVIGPHWLMATDATGQHRIDDPDDWLRRELVEAFAAGVRVIPIVTDDATLPTEADLPADIAALSRYQARPLRRRELTNDLTRIIADLAALDADLAAAKRHSTTPPGVVNTISGNISGTVFQAGTITGGVHLDRGRPSRGRVNAADRRPPTGVYPC
jgi:hypothetical protein